MTFDLFMIMTLNHQCQQMLHKGKHCMLQLQLCLSLRTSVFKDASWSNTCKGKHLSDICYCFHNAFLTEFQVQFMLPVLSVAWYMWLFSQCVSDRISGSIHAYCIVCSMMWYTVMSSFVQMYQGGISVALGLQCFLLILDSCLLFYTLPVLTLCLDPLCLDTLCLDTLCLDLVLKLLSLNDALYYKTTQI